MILDDVFKSKNNTIPVSPRVVLIKALRTKFDLSLEEAYNLEEWITQQFKNYCSSYMR